MIRLLRGRVAIRRLGPPQGLVVLPDQYGDWDRKSDQSKGIKAKSSHSAVVLGMGPPAIGAHGHEVPYHFEAGDEIVYVYHHNEKLYDGQVWDDGGPVEYVAQEEVLAVMT